MWLKLLVPALHAPVVSFRRPALKLRSKMRKQALVETNVDARETNMFSQLIEGEAWQLFNGGQGICRNG